MENSFTEIMSKRTDEELIKIVTVDRESYQPIAMEAAEEEIKRRDIDHAKFDEVKTAYTKLADLENQIEANKVSTITRFIHFLVDTIVVLIIVTALSFLVSPLATSSNQSLFGYLLLSLSFFGYYIFMESKYQKTLSKFLTKTKVIMKDGRKPELGDIIRRTACRLVPFDRVSYLFSANGIHDHLSNTRVVKEPS